MMTPVTPTPAAERDGRGVLVERHDAITAAGACIEAAVIHDRRARSRRFQGPHNASTRRWERQIAADYRDAAARLQEVADRSWDAPTKPNPQWCPVCKTYHDDPGVWTDAGEPVKPCPIIPADDPRQRR